MTTPTTKLALSKPMGNEINNRTAFNELIDQIDAAAMKDSLFCKSAVYNGGTSKIDVTFSPGVAMFLQTIVNKSVDSIYSIPSPAINTSYFIYLSSAGTFSSNTTGVEVDGAVVLWKVSTGSVLTTISTLDLRGIVDGSAQMVKDLLDAHQIAADPHSQYSLDTDLTTHKLAATLDHPDGSVTDAKFGNRTIDDTVTAATGADTPTRLWSKLGNIIKQITGGAAWYTAPVTTIVALFAKFHATTGHGHTGTTSDGPQILAAGLANGAATDTVIGIRTITDSTAQTAGAAAAPTTLFGQIGNMIKGITGKAAWYTPPVTTIEALNTAMALRMPINNAVATGTFTLAADPVSALQAATKQYSDSFINTSPLPTALNPIYGQQVVTATKASPFNVINLCGNTLVNLLGKNGNMQDITKWSDGGTTHVADTTNFTIGAQSIKMTETGTSGYMVSSTTFNMVSSNYYILLADIKNGNATTASLTVTSNSPTANTSTSDSTKFVTCYARFTGLNITNATVSPTMGGTAGQYVYFAAIRMYQVTLAQYNAVGSLTQAQLNALYPYVDDVKHVNAPYITRIGENMLPPFSEWTLHANATVTEPYKLTLAATANSQYSYVDLPIVPSQQYTVSATHNGKIGLDLMDDSNNILSALGWSVSTSISFTVTAATKKVRIYFGNDTLGAGTYTFTNPRLNIGAVDKGFKPRNDDYLFFPNQSLASSVDGTVYDQLFSRDGKWFKETRFVRDLVLDGSLTWAFLDDQTGRKRIQIAGFTGIIPTNVNSVATKYDGKILINGADTTGADGFNYYNPGITISVADTDSGWGETWAGTASATGATATQLIQAFFNGWKYTGNFTTDSWTSLVDGSVASTQTIAYVTANKAPNFKPYKLTYQLAVPTFEEIAFEGSLSTLEGGNQIEVGNGMIVREKTAPFLNVGGGVAEINRSVLPLSRRTVKNLAVYKNGKLDLTWILQQNQSTVYWNGSAGAYTTFANYDPTATYEVTYLALDQYALTANVQTINGEYNSNIKTIVDSTVQNVSDINTRLSVVENGRARKVQGQWIAPTLLNSWVNFGGSFATVAYLKDEFGFIHLKGTIKSGTTTPGTAFFNFPIGYRPLSDLNFPVVCSNGSVDLIGRINLTTLGSLTFQTGGNNFLMLDGITFLAEQ